MAIRAVALTSQFLTIRVAIRPIIVEAVGTREEL